MPYESYPGRSVVDDGSCGIGMPALLGMSVAGLSRGEVGNWFCLAISSAFAMADSRCCTSRWISSSTSGAKSQRRIHFPKLTVDTLATRMG